MSEKISLDSSELKIKNKKWGRTLRLPFNNDE